MKALALVLSLCILGPNVAAQEVVSDDQADTEAECKADPVAEERAVADAQRGDLARGRVLYGASQGVGETVQTSVTVSACD